MKYIIDIEDTPKDGLYKATNFKTLVFDEYGLSRLEKVPEPEPEEPILVGDEVASDVGHTIFVVTYVGNNEVCGIDFGGNIHAYMPDEVHRTGRQFKVLLEFEGGDVA